MRNLLIAICLFIISWESIAQTDEEIIRSIYDEQLTNSKVYENLRILTKNIGNRLSGSTNLDSAIVFTKKLMLKYGFDTVYLQPVMVSNWKRGNKEICKIIDAQNNSEKLVRCLALGNSIGTNESSVEGEVIEIRGMSELESISNEVIKGKIVFLNESLDSRHINTFKAYSQASTQREYGTSLASSKGAIGVIIRSLSISKDEFPRTGYMEYTDSVNKIPTIAISSLEADRLSEQLTEKRNIKASIELHCKTLDNVLSYNVIGEIKGSIYTDSIIVVGGHIDSWDVGEGAHDNGGGCLQSIEVLRTLKVLNIEPKHTIRVVLWVDEENSWAGNIEYAKQSKINKEKHIAAIESDRGSYNPLGFYIETENSMTFKKVTSWKTLFDPYRVSIFQRNHAGIDITPLKDDSNLLMVLMTNNQKYFKVHHSENDVFEEVDKRELELCAATLTSIVYLIDKYGID
jgi:hypothetical protein